MRTLIFLALLSSFTIKASLAEGFVIDTSQCTVYVRQEPAPAYCPPPVPVAAPTCSPIWTRAKRQEMQCMSACPAPIPPCAPVCQVPVQAYVPPPQPCPPSPCQPVCGSPCEKKLGFGFGFDWEGRISPIVDSVRPFGGFVLPDRFHSGDSFDIAPTTSLFTPGLGLKYKDCQNNGFTLGVRPEFVLTPHCLGGSNILNWGMDCDRQFPIGPNTSEFISSDFSDWLIPEYLMEYKWDQGQKGLGLAFKTYHLRLRTGIENCDDRTTLASFPLASLPTLSLYGKYRGFVLGYNFVSLNRSRFGEAFDIGRPFSILGGYSSSF